MKKSHDLNSVIDTKLLLMEKKKAVPIGFCVLILDGVMIGLLSVLASLVGPGEVEDWDEEEGVTVFRLC